MKNVLFMNSRVRGHAIYVSSLTCRFVHSGILEPPKEIEIGFKNHIGREMGLKLHCSTDGRDTTFGSNQWVVKKGQTNRRFEKFGIPLYLYAATAERKLSTKAFVYHKLRRLSLS